jgi:hypothetical protein
LHHKLFLVVCVSCKVIISHVGDPHFSSSSTPWHIHPFLEATIIILMRNDDDDHDDDEKSEHPTREKKSSDAWQKSSGAFDVTMGPLIRAVSAVGGEPSKWATRWDRVFTVS